MKVSAAKIDRLTDRIIAYRFWRHYKRKYEERRVADMALEFKGLKAIAMTTRASIGNLHQAYDALNAKVVDHTSDVQSLTEQVGYVSDDMAFIAAALGNSVAASNGATEAAQPAKVPPATFTAEPPIAIQQPPATDPAAILNGQPGMRGLAHNPDVQLIRS